MKLEILKQIISKKEKKTEFAIVTNLATGNSEIFEKDKTLSKDFKNYSKEINNLYNSKKNGIIEGSEIFVETYTRPIKVIIVGAVHIAQYLADFAKSLNFEILIIDPRGYFASKQRFPDIKIINKWPKEAFKELETDKNTALIALTHDPKIDDRVKYKRLMLEAKQEYENTKDPKLKKDISRYDNIQMAKKISLNSAYGAIGNSYFRYYNLLVAEAITTSGQLSIRWIERSLNRYLNQTLGTDDLDYVIASDTDSVYITFDRLINKLPIQGENTGEVINFLDRLARDKIEPFIDQSYQDLARHINAYEQKKL